MHAIRLDLQAGKGCGSQQGGERKKGLGTQVTSPYAVTLWIDGEFRFRIVELEVALADLAAILDGDDSLLEPVLFDRSCEQKLSRVSRPV